MTTALLVLLIALLVFATGALTGLHLNTRAQEVRDRRQAAVQRELNNEWHALRDIYAVLGKERNS